MDRKMRGWLICMAIILLVLAACSKKETLEDSLPELEEDEEEVLIEEEEPVVSYRAPFTGMAIEEENLRRPVLVTINNHPLARSQSGISDADIIYEFIAEANVTRFLALFQSELPEEIGPIRSARDYFVHVAQGLDAFYVAHGYSPDAQKLLQSGFVDNVNGMQYDGTLFKRSTDRKAPHNSYISGDNVLVAADKANASMEMKKMPPLSFHDALEDAKIGDDAFAITVRYGTDPNFTSNHVYDADKGTYTRTVNERVTTDKVNDEQVEVANVLVFEVDYSVIDDIGRQAVDLESGGKALLFQAGLAQAINWKNDNGILTPVVNGIPAKLVPGKTWIHIVPTKPGMETSVTYTP
ncbi:DUF3048 domain-containing protein [Sporosarcina sp. FSL K6-1522]|uniref:DUF3048 domain-containing protein n=1 Tax=Sporosarcina sp. FSL K6-1522 TaxID=2921554 RepID=UPI00315B081D